MLYQRAKVFRIFSNGWSWNMKIPLCQAVNKAVLTFATVRLPSLSHFLSLGMYIDFSGFESSQNDRFVCIGPDSKRGS